MVTSDRTGPLRRLAASSRLHGQLAGLSPGVLVSDVRDVVYLNYLGAADRLEHLLPAGLELQRLGPARDLALFSILVYRHGHLGPRWCGPARRVLPSPLQSNWRLYVRDPRTGRDGVHFLTMTMSRPLYVLGSRLLAEGLPVHTSGRTQVRSRADGGFTALVEPGPGGPDLRAELVPADARTATPWRRAYPTYAAMLADVVPQNRGLAVAADGRHVIRQEIQVELDLDTCRPLDGSVRSRAVREIVGADAEMFAFAFSRGRLTVHPETRDALSSPA